MLLLLHVKFKQLVHSYHRYKTRSHVCMLRGMIPSFLNSLLFPCLIQRVRKYLWQHTPGKPRKKNEGCVLLWILCYLNIKLVSLRSCALRVKICFHLDANSTPVRGKAHIHSYGDVVAFLLTCKVWPLLEFASQGWVESLNSNAPLQ